MHRSNKNSATNTLFTRPPTHTRFSSSGWYAILSYKNLLTPKCNNCGQNRKQFGRLAYLVVFKAEG